MTAIDSLPVDVFDLSETEQQLVEILFPSKESASALPPEPDSLQLQLQPQLQPQSQSQSQSQPKECEYQCPTATQFWSLVQDVLLLLFCILLFQMSFWDSILGSLSQSKQIFVKLSIMIILIICIKKFLSR